MCIIVVKPKGIEPPTLPILKNCFTNNDDGAGFMYHKDDKVIVQKGFMTFDSLREALEERQFGKDDIVVYHFRISTGGGICAENTHPFPITDSVSELKAHHIKVDMALAHNGVLSIKPSAPDLNDTQEFIRSILSAPDVREGLYKQDGEVTKAVLDLIGHSRLCIMSGPRLTMLGSGWIHHDNGLIFSNSSYEERKIYTYNYDKNWHYNHQTGKWYTKVKGKWYEWDYDYEHGTRHIPINFDPTHPQIPCSGGLWNDKGEDTGAEAKEDTIDKELKEIIEEQDDMLAQALDDFLNMFFDKWRGEGTKWDYDRTFAYAFNKIKDRLIAIDPADAKALALPAREKVYCSECKKHFDPETEDNLRDPDGKYYCSDCK